MMLVIHLKKSLLTALAFLFFSIAAYAQTSVLTQHNNINRTGWNDQETILNKKNVQPGSFGKLFVRVVDDQIYAQPLVKLKLNIPGKGIKNVVFVATVNNTVYAFDADSANSATPYWQVNLTVAGARPPRKTDMVGACGGFYNDFSGNMGIVGTPVIDSTTNTLYVVARSLNATTNVYYQYLHALDITTGAEKPNSPVRITASVNGTGDGSSGGKVSFDSQKNNQRPGLLLLNGLVYIGWSSHCDWGPYHGWIMSYDKTTLVQKNVYCSTADGYNGGIWMSGGGMSADENGNVYAAVGNGSVGKGNNASDLANRSESALKLSSALTISSFFTPKNYEVLEGADLDFGVTQMMLIPNTNRVMVGVKDGKLYLLNRDNMGGYNSTTDNILQTIDLGGNAFLRSSMSYYKGAQKEFVYSWSENSLLRAFPYSRTTNLFDLPNTVSSGIQGPTGNNGALLSVSSNGAVDSTAILWASHAANGDANQSVRPGILRAIDATDVTKELWNSSTYPEDVPGNYAKFNCPTVANGKVYLGTFSNQLVVYGLTGNKPDSCGIQNIALNKPAYASSLETPDYYARNVTDGKLNTRWSSVYSDPQNIYVDLGSSYDICKVVLHWQIALGKDFKIQVSDNAINWTDVASYTGNTSYNNYVSLKASGRYVRMYGTKRGSQYGYSLWEFEVYGKPSVNSCPVPTGLYTSDVYENTATLHWNPVSATGYNVQYKTVTATNWVQTTSTPNSIVLNGLSCSTPYLYRIQTVCSDGTSAFSTQGSFTTLACEINCDPLPTRWSTQDIGDVGTTGSACYNSTTGTFELKGSGADIWDTQDAFRFAYKTLVGNGDIKARVVDIDNINPWNKAGIMVRESLDPSSRHVFIALTSGNGVAFQRRVTTGGYSDNDNTANTNVAPQWLKINITGTTYTAFKSTDGLTWTQVGPAVDAGFGGGQPVYAGLAITSHDYATLSTAHIDNYSLGGVLPLKLISFTGHLTLNKTVDLNWITTLETKTKYFIVERTTDFMNFKTIDTVYAENNGEFTQNYAAKDMNPLKSINYYRLRIVDMDGQVSYSPVVAIRVTNAKAPLMYPNPANGFVNIAQGTESMRQITIYNVVGKAVIRIPNATSQSLVNIPTNTLANGLYFVEIRTPQSVYRDKLIVHN
ncbi:T9SS type A sorting domain-containing protein [Panacibacter ginsenosidivorans]|uniref:T9SS type A sorting domain-containing protein n=1 Tax=Panacibacter ginsenosidivorans TaxID=1813871 RepID=A0A5B8V8R9_9BACT|nr:discoidin domain-containing protein [Panacibacter ginsenosidivorans]QEC67241.1 T9SS type A sorting domain-containing protein [Panacibacter ginsenosidivorans]